MLSLAPHGERPMRDGKIEEASIVPGHPKFTDEFQASEIVADGARENWEGRVWMNHPYSCGIPWALAMRNHGDGIALTAAKSTDTAWCQEFLLHCDLALFLRGRIRFHYPDGTKSVGAWLPNVLWAFGERNCEALRRLHHEAWPGVLVKREDRLAMYHRIGSVANVGCL